jgi:hypothetical protein
VHRWYPSEQAAVWGFSQCCTLEDLQIVDAAQTLAAESIAADNNDSAAHVAVVAVGVAAQSAAADKDDFAAHAVVPRAA